MTEEELQTKLITRPQDIWPGGGWACVTTFIGDEALNEEELKSARLLSEELQFNTKLKLKRQDAERIGILIRRMVAEIDRLKKDAEGNVIIWKWVDGDLGRIANIQHADGHFPHDDNYKRQQLRKKLGFSDD